MDGMSEQMKGLLGEMSGNLEKFKGDMKLAYDNVNPDRSRKIKYNGQNVTVSISKNKMIWFDFDDKSNAEEIFNEMTK
jgi:hypothetical protein